MHNTNFVIQTRYSVITSPVSKQKSNVTVTFQEKLMSPTAAAKWAHVIRKDKDQAFKDQDKD